ncbi:MAG TPA: DNA adenine methylase, partial [Thermoanaerobacterium sp.]|nr:DNA adenine methylase [Thermoanaerobacterium sp.]
MSRTTSPLRYPGGKNKFYKKMVSILERNKINNVTYVEPFAGGAGLAISLLINNKV